MMESPANPLERSPPSISKIFTDFSTKPRISPNPCQPPSNPVQWSSWLLQYQSGQWAESPQKQVNDQVEAQYTTDSSCLLFNSSSNNSRHVGVPKKAHFAKPSHCPRKDRLVKCDDGKILDSYDFYQTHGWLAAPLVPHRIRNKRAEALRRHHVTGPQERKVLNLYIKHAKAVFKVDYSSFMVAGTDDAEMLILAQQGGQPDVQRVNRNVTLCAHAMLLEKDKVLVVNDTQNDWRFQTCPSTTPGTICNQSGKAMRFYASAPLRLSYSRNGSEDHVQVGRLCIMAEQPRDFSEDDADLLISIATMASEALEKEHQSRLNAKAADMQRRCSSLIRMMEDPKNLQGPRLNESLSDPVTSSAESLEGLLRFSTTIIETACDEIRTCLGATTVAAVDVSGFRVKRLPQHNVSPKASAYPMTPWQSVDAKDLAAPMTPPSELDGPSTAPHVISPLGSPRMIRHQTTKSRSSFVEDIEAPDGSMPAQILCYSGPEKFLPKVRGQLQSQTLCEWLAKAAREDKMGTRSRLFRINPDSFLSSDEEADTSASDSSLNTNPLGPLLPSDTNLYQYVAAIVFSSDKTRPLFFFIAMFENAACIEEQEHLFVESCLQFSAGSLLRQKIIDVDVIQAEFLRHVQHNLRTPLHGALGAVDYLRGAIANEDEDDDGKIDLSADGVLATLLDSIALSGSTLNSYIDDLLSFQNLAGLKPGRGAAKLSSTDLVKLVEDACNEEWEFAQRLELQSQRMQLAPSGPLTSMELIIKATPSVSDREWLTDSHALRKIVRKVVSNAIRFTRQGYVEVSLRSGKYEPGQSDPVPVVIEFQDTGMGMTRHFCTEQLTRPFTKGDSFRDGIGLGMTIASSTVQNMGGKLLVASEVNVGTRVTVTLPLVPSHNPSRTFSSSSTITATFAVGTIAFYGMDTRGLRRLSNSICEHLIPLGGLELVRDPREADCIVLSEKVIPALREGDNPLLDQLRSDARLVILAEAPLLKKPQGFEVLLNRPILPFPMPHGPSSLKLLETFLRESEPIVLRSPFSLQPSSQSRTDASEINGAAHHSNKEAEPAPTMSDAPKVEPFSSTALTSTDDASVDGILPSVPTQLNGNSTASPCTPPTSSEQNKSEFRVLLVEDNPINMKLLTALCRKLAISYEEAHDGAEAVTKFINFRPDVVLLDISLPIQDGFEACSQMRTYKYPSFIVAITALSSEEDKIRGIESCGMDVWMTKPVSTRQLRQQLVMWKSIWEANGTVKLDDTSDMPLADNETTTAKETCLTVTNGGATTTAGATH